MRHPRSIPAFALLSLLVLASGAEARAQAPTPRWLSLLNEYRKASGLQEVVEDPTLSKEALLHAIYSVKNGGYLEHSEDPAKPFYTPEGHASAQASNGSGKATEEGAIGDWIQAPFHLVGMLDPNLERTGFGQYAEGGVASAWLDVIRGQARPMRPAPKRPIFFPGDGATIPYTKHVGEVPDPLQSCPGYAIPSGLPLVVQLPPGASGAVTASSFAVNGATLEHCVFSWKSFNYPVKAWQDVGRSILEARRAVVLIPRRPLSLGAHYTVTIEADGAKHSWSFSTSPPAAAASSGSFKRTR